MAKVKLTIDGVEVEAEEGSMVLEACLDSGTFVPHYCFHKGLSVAGNCRMCMVEVHPPMPPGAKPRPVTKPSISCATEVAEGMVVHTQSELAREARTGVLEFLLINHPLDCPVCDQAGECDLQDFSFKYGQGESVFLEEKLTKQTKDFGPDVRYYGNRCINCTRCVRFTQEIAGTSELGQVQRGGHSEIDMMPGTTLDGPLSGNVVDICPVGALVSRDFLHKSRVWHLDKTDSICPHCATGCNIEIHTKDEVVQRLKPRHNPKVNSYWMCDTGRAGYKHVHAPGRLTAATKRAGDGERQRVSFQEVVAETAGLVAGAGDDLQIWASAWLTNEELWLIRSLFPSKQIGLLAREAGEEKRFFPSWGVSERNPALAGQHERGALADDGATFVISADRNPNTLGAQRILGKTACGTRRRNKLIKDAVAGSHKLALVFGAIPEFEAEAELLEALAGVEQVIVVALADGPLAQAAHVLVPGAAFAEKRGSFVNGAGMTQRIGFAVPTPGQTRCELEFLGALAAKMGQDVGPCSPQRLFEAMTAEVKGFDGVSWDDALHRSPRWSPHMAAAEPASAGALFEAGGSES